MRVYEFAKEAGIETLVLMDKIKEWKLPVKSHMSDLTEDLIDTIKLKLSEPQAGKSGKKVAKKKKVTRKKATTKKATAKKTSAKKTTTKKTSAKKTSSKKTAEPIVKTRTVVRRKASEKVKVKPIVLEEDKSPVDAKTSVITSEVKSNAPSVDAKIADNTVAVTSSQSEATNEASSLVKPNEVKAETKAPSVKVSAGKEVVENNIEKATEITPDTVNKTKKEVKPTPSRKREVVMTSAGLVSGVKSDAPRKNIVGKIDLNKMKELQKKHSSQQTSSIRPGFTSDRSSSSGDQPPLSPEDLLNRRRVDDKGVKKKIGVGSARGETKEQLPPSFTASEFRKREMVFQPRKKKGMLGRASKKTKITTPKASKRVVKVNKEITVSDLAQELGVKLGKLSKSLISNGIMAKPNAMLDFDTVALIVPDFGFEAQNVHMTGEALIEAAAFGNLDAEPITRPPIVAVMGHVDHGKTTLLDCIRKTDVVSGEAGGITQHIGAYQVKTKSGLVTFLDTPGHEAFTAMRARGANVTDIAIIVVAADDGIMPQTVEAINHAKSAKVPIIVAVNKIDKPQANSDKVKQQLAEHELTPEEWGGETIFAEVSALKKQGIDNLLEQILLMAEIQELKANPDRSASGIIIESQVSKGKGNVATVLVSEGTLKIGQYFVAGETTGRIRALKDYNGKTIKEAGPSMPVEIMGLDSCPQAGDSFDVTPDERTALEVVDSRLSLKGNDVVKKASSLSLEDLFSKVRTGEVKELPVVLKTDVAGTSEAIMGMFEKFKDAEVKIKVIHKAVGGINESDVLLASTAQGIVVGFNVKPDSGAEKVSKQKAVEIKTYNIVYELMDDMKLALSGMLDPDIIEVAQGRAVVRETFSVPKIGTIAGCYVEEGKITRNSLLRLVRDGKTIHEGNVSSLKRFKDDVKEVATNFECGIGIEDYNDLKVGDFIDSFVKEEKQRQIEL